MKKNYYILFVFLMLTFGYSQCQGDANLDDTINIQDIILTINLVLNNEYNVLADLNLDETIDVLDIVQLVNIILN